MKRILTIALLFALTLAGMNHASAALDSVDILIKALVDKQIITEDDASAAMVVRQIDESTQAFVRYDNLNPDTCSAVDNSTNLLSLGINRFLYKDGYTRWQLNYEIKGDKGTAISNNLLTAQLQAGF